MPDKYFPDEEPHIHEFAKNKGLGFATPGTTRPHC